MIFSIKPLSVVLLIHFNKFIIMRVNTETKIPEPNPEIKTKSSAQRSYSEHRLIKL
jgi:hypothetical protein